MLRACFPGRIFDQESLFMPEKYHISISNSPHRFPIIPKYSTIEFEGCIGCLKCVKRYSCIYDVYKKRAFDPVRVADTADSLCISCLRCVQECRKNILSKTHNPLYSQLGNYYWTPDIISSIWNQAETGNIPVSGAGYRGYFTGPGFDSIWTDMSEIVRPTRDGIHGREYISTVIELGSRPGYLKFDGSGGLSDEIPHFHEIPLPIILSCPETVPEQANINTAISSAARDLEIFFINKPNGTDEFTEAQIVKLGPELPDLSLLKEVKIVELAFSDDVQDTIKKIKSLYPRMTFSIKIPLDEDAFKNSSEMVSRGIEMIHFCADKNGRGFGRFKDRFVSDMIRTIHRKFINSATRYRFTILVSGGIALAEHIPKIIICGADCAVIDTALMASLECRICSRCDISDDCPSDMQNIPPDWGKQRIINLIGCWHSQLIEVLGAMGIREVRRLRGETGRAMFYSDMEKECFEPLFGSKKSDGITDMFPAHPDDADTFAATENPPACISRFRNAVSIFRVIRTSSCTGCGKCIQVCRYHVHRTNAGRLLKPLSYKCHGPQVCRSNNSCCTDLCPEKALLVGPDPMFSTIGDPRWTPELIYSTWIQSETGNIPDQKIEYRKGASGGGFDSIDFDFDRSYINGTIDKNLIDLSVKLNKSSDDRPQITLGFPGYGGGMSFGSISIGAMISRARAYKHMDSFISTGEGGYPSELNEFDDHIITQVATGLFGVSEDTIKRVRIVEFKYAQGAKPGLGGHLLGDKVTPVVARMREAVEGSALFSPFPFHSVYSVEDHKKHIDWIKTVNPRALISVKVSTPADVDMVAIGSFYAGAHIIHLDGSYGGTGAAPDIAKKNIAMPIEYAICKVHNFLLEEGVRDKITLVASGGLRTAFDTAKAIALGADAVVIGTADLIALECLRCGKCESGRGCPRGIATTDPELTTAVTPDWGTQRIINLYNSWAFQLREILWHLGLNSIEDLVGRTDFLVHRDYSK